MNTFSTQHKVSWRHPRSKHDLNLNLALDRWEHFRDTVYNAAMTTLGKKTRKSVDWLEAHSEADSLQSLPQRTQSAVCQMKITLLKSATGEVIQDRTQQMEHWVEHYSELYARENIVTADALNAIECLPMLEELDAEPTFDELSKALDSLATGKAPGKDGDRSVCNNYHGISLLCIIGKLVTHITLNRLPVLAVYPRSQCGFRANRSTTMDMVFSIRQLQEKCREQRQPLFVAFIDLTKAFDLVSREGFFKILPKIGCLPRLLDRACVLNTLLYGSESWTLRARQERKLIAFHMRCLCRILHITWQDKITNNSILERAGITSMYTLLKQRCMRWLGHVVCMDNADPNYVTKTAARGT
ncbi:uncharacterized protein LOC134788764 [Penaeus indicus]|uniref:uncharacterized protein LOC134788764 n=1 Tax=Penaeus indicus TaxID=29960 RepID=UPI00300C1615